MKDKETMKAIIDNYLEMEKSLVTQLHYQVPKHATTIGGFREEIWKNLFEQIIPKKYVIEQSVFLMDSEGQVSKEVDLAIFDETYTPYIFRNGRIKFIPIEAVTAVVQCKSTDVNSDDLETWCKSIEELVTSPNSVTRLANNISEGSAITQNGTRPIRILCALRKSEESLKKFDINLIAKDNQIDVLIPNEDKWTLDRWHRNLNMNGANERKREWKKIDKTLLDYKIEHNGNNVSLLSLNLQLNQLLMLINNPMFFPHISYVNMFKRSYTLMLEEAIKKEK